MPGIKEKDGGSPVRERRNTSMRIVKKMDEMGRLVIPLAIREALGLQPNADVVMELEGNRIVLQNGDRRCRICGGCEELISFEGGHLCRSCIRKIHRL